MKGKRFLSIWVAVAMAGALVLAGCEGPGAGGGGFATPSYKSIDEVEAYLRDASGETSVDTPVALRVELDLAIYWAALLEAIAGAGKYVALDLSVCTMSGMTGTEGEFDPGTATTDTANTGKSRIVSLVLPDAATSIKARDEDEEGLPFQYFIALKSVSGSKIITVGDYAFSHCDALTEVELPAATTIGYYAFDNCTALTTVSLPAAEIIDAVAFIGCTALTTVSLPAARSIGRSAFVGCSALTTVYLPAATTIDGGAFQFCTELTEVDLPKAADIGRLAFLNCTALTTVTLGSKAPTLGTGMFDGITAAKTVTVKVPTLATGYGDVWKDGFQGGNSNITLVIEYGP